MSSSLARLEHQSIREKHPVFEQQTLLYLMGKYNLLKSKEDREKIVFLVGRNPILTKKDSDNILSFMIDFCSSDILKKASNQEIVCLYEFIIALGALDGASDKNCARFFSYFFKCFFDLQLYREDFPSQLVPKAYNLSKKILVCRGEDSHSSQAIIDGFYCLVRVCTIEQQLEIIDLISIFSDSAFKKVNALWDYVQEPILSPWVKDLALDLILQALKNKNEPLKSRCAAFIYLQLKASPSKEMEESLMKKLSLTLIEMIADSGELLNYREACMGLLFNLLLEYDKKKIIFRDGEKEICLCLFEKFTELTEEVRQELLSSLQKAIAVKLNDPVLGINNERGMIRSKI